MPERTGVHRFYDCPTVRGKGSAGQHKQLHVLIHQPQALGLKAEPGGPGWASGDATPEVVGTMCAPRGDPTRLFLRFLKDPRTLSGLKSTSISSLRGAQRRAGRKSSPDLPELPALGPVPTSCVAVSRPCHPLHPSLLNCKWGQSPCTWGHCEDQREASLNTQPAAWRRYPTHVPDGSCHRKRQGCPQVHTPVPRGYTTMATPSPWVPKKEPWRFQSEHVFLRGTKLLFLKRPPAPGASQEHSHAT